VRICWIIDASLVNHLSASCRLRQETTEEHNTTSDIVLILACCATHQQRVSICKGHRTNVRGQSCSYAMDGRVCCKASRIFWKSSSDQCPLDPVRRRHHNYIEDGHQPSQRVGPTKPQNLCQQGFRCVTSDHVIKTTWHQRRGEPFALHLQSLKS
jgi:hypothetical protein